MGRSRHQANCWTCCLCQRAQTQGPPPPTLHHMYPWLWQPASHQPRLPEGKKERWKKIKKVAVKEGREECMNIRVEQKTEKQHQAHCWNHGLKKGVNGRRCKIVGKKTKCKKLMETYCLRGNSFELSCRKMEMNDSLLSREKVLAMSIPHSPPSSSGNATTGRCQWQLTQCRVSVFFSFTPCWQHLCQIILLLKSLNLIIGWNENIPVTPEGEKRQRERKGRKYREISKAIRAEQPLSLFQGQLQGHLMLVMYVKSKGASYSFFPNTIRMFALQQDEQKGV